MHFLMFLWWYIFQRCWSLLIIKYNPKNEKNEKMKMKIAYSADWACVFRFASLVWGNLSPEEPHDFIGLSSFATVEWNYTTPKYERIASEFLLCVQNGSPLHSPFYFIVMSQIRLKRCTSFVCTGLSHALTSGQA